MVEPILAKSVAAADTISGAAITNDMPSLQFIAGNFEVPDIGGDPTLLPRAPLTHQACTFPTALLDHPAAVAQRGPAAAPQPLQPVQLGGSINQQRAQLPRLGA